jgi:acylphosphatase
MSESVIRRRAVVRGRVQAVFFRDFIREQAEAASVAGSVRNREDGSVELILEGPRDAVERVLSLAHEGPDRAKVQDIEVSDEQPQGLSSFKTD